MNEDKDFKPQKKYQQKYLKQSKLFEEIATLIKYDLPKELTLEKIIEIVKSAEN